VFGGPARPRINPRGGYWRPVRSVVGWRVGRGSENETAARSGLNRNPDEGITKDIIMSVQGFGRPIGILKNDRLSEARPRSAPSWPQHGPAASGGPGSCWVGQIYLVPRPELPAPHQGSHSGRQRPSRQFGRRARRLPVKILDDRRRISNSPSGSKCRFLLAKPGSFRASNIDSGKGPKLPTNTIRWRTYRGLV
jgi:hypothetical protein